MTSKPAYHQAFMAQARGMWATYRCPCGCAARPTIEDLARDLWAQSLVGSVPTSKALVVQAFVPTPGREKAEPTVSGICRGCGSRMVIYEYLAAFLRLRAAPWPECDSCLALQVQ